MAGSESAQNPKYAAGACSCALRRPSPLCRKLRRAGGLNVLLHRYSSRATRHARTA